MTYLTLGMRDTDGDWFFTVPDVEGFTAAGNKDLVAAQAEAADVLRSHLEEVVKAGGRIPIPRRYEDLKADPAFAEDFAEAEVVTTLPLLPFETRQVRVNVTIDEGLLGAIDETAKRLKVSRSAFLAQAAERLLASAH